MTKKYVRQGDVIRNGICDGCGKVFRGNMRNVDKQMDMHVKYVHNDKSFDMVYTRVQNDISTNKLIKPEEAERDFKLARSLLD